MRAHSLAAAAALIGTTLILTSSAEASDVLRFDVDGFEESADVTEPGFARLTEPGMRGDSGRNGAFVPTATLEGVTVTVEGARGWRDRDVPPGTYGHPSVLRDFVSSRASGEGLTLRIAGLGDGLHEIVSWHQDWNVWSSPTTFDAIATDALGDERMAYDDAVFEPFVDPPITYRVGAIEGEEVVVHYRPDGAAIGVRFNGLTIQDVDLDDDFVADDEDNCPVDPNRDQADFDADGEGDACDADDDDDGVLDEADLCPATIIPEAFPTRALGVNRFALVDGDLTFDTTEPAGVGPRRTYTTTDTAGCSCEQVAELLHLGEGHAKHGCSVGAMDRWSADAGD